MVIGTFALARQPDAQPPIKLRTEPRVLSAKVDTTFAVRKRDNNLELPF
jgi:hypothetical protein